MAEEQRSSSGNGEEPTEEERTKAVVRRTGRVILIGGGFVFFVFLMVGVVQGIRNDRAWNPYTGLPQEEGRCLESARKLMLDAGEMDQISANWINRYRVWVTRCKDNHAELFELLRATHSELQNLPEEES